MPYTPELKNFIKVVEKTRPARVAMKSAVRNLQEFPWIKDRIFSGNFILILLMEPVEKSK